MPLPSQPFTDCLLHWLLHPSAAPSTALSEAKAIHPLPPSPESSARLAQQ